MVALERVGLGWVEEAGALEEAGAVGEVGEVEADEMDLSGPVEAAQVGRAAKADEHGLFAPAVPAVARQAVPARSGCSVRSASGCPEPEPARRRWRLEGWTTPS